MKAIVQEEYGPPNVLQPKEIDKPAVGDHDVLVRVQAAAVHPGDYFVLTGLPYVVRLAFGIRKPKNGVPGRDVAGSVEAVGKDVTRFQAGDEVFGWCTTGVLAEYACAEESNFARKPVNLTFEQAAAVAVSGTTALQALRDHGEVQPEQKVLIAGASGGVGTFAVQIAKAFGAEVTGVCSTRNVDMVRSIGADHVIDYTKEDFTQSGQRYDVILDNVEDHSLSECRRVLASQGTYIPNRGTGGRWIGPLGRIAKARMVSLFVRQRLRPFLSKENTEDLFHLKELIESGKVTPVIDRTYPLSKSAEALAYVAEGHARGKVAISV
ncbi:MAG: NAD(P)-dependent alcohol dehydrogenase [Candidatus Limnocylindria bacterium]